MPHKILIVEDDKFVRELISHKLTEEKFEVSSVKDGEEGVAKVESEKPDLVLLDLILPGIDGFEVISRIRKNPDIESIPIVILSNLGEKNDVDRGIKLGANDYMIKAHFTPKEIVEKVRSILK
jgi:DNA-binding response OmpR family regulator